MSDADIAASVDAASGLVSGAPENSRIAVVTMQGSMCPVTRAHVDAVLEARKLLRGLKSRLAEVAQRPKQLPKFDIVIGFIGVNEDDYVSSKLGGRTHSAGFLHADVRRELIDLATSKHDWIVSCSNIWKCAQELLDVFPKRDIAWYELDGADVALKSRTWNKAWKGRRYACVGRPADPGMDNGTEAVIRNMEEADKGLTSEWYHQGNYLILPELPAISSTKVRRAVQKKETAALKKLVHADVARCLLDKSFRATKLKTGSTAVAAHSSVRMLRILSTVFCGQTLLSAAVPFSSASSPVIGPTLPSRWVRRMLYNQITTRPLLAKPHMVAGHLFK
eukprot:TRINITY_DN77720_c0_g1_i1.p1 TRINITY_DN77720_c0_g1~~TRINITY_DN77720_c0_g1_i1.p1  ORF type:complete len:335 (-),score=54.96 TRINITY_DN77720_c0_g1_i1:95-1099(-)